LVWWATTLHGGPALESLRARLRRRFLGPFLGFLLIISVIVWGTAFAALHFRRELKGSNQGVDSEMLARLLEDVDQLSTRLSRLEEEMDFFKELRAPESRGRLSPPDPPDQEPRGGEEA